VPGLRDLLVPTIGVSRAPGGSGPLRESPRMRVIFHILTYAGSATAAGAAVIAQAAAPADPRVAHQSILIGIGALVTAASPVIVTAMRVWIINKREEREFRLHMADIPNQIRATVEEAKHVARREAELKAVEAVRVVDEKIDVLDQKKADLVDTKAIAVTAAANAGRLDAALRRLEQIGEISPHIGAGGNKSRILVVGDSVEFMRSYADVFTELGFDVATAGTVAQATKMIRDRPPHCIILNLLLPDGSGIDVLRMVREEHVRSKVAVVTRVTDEAIMEQVRLLKPDHFQHRPTDLERLVKFIDPSLELKR
jgi:CheY-like chemotaxis protein